MGKRRSIDSKIRSSQSFANLTYRQRDLWQGIIAVADDQGRMHANPMYIRSAVWPYDDIKPDEVVDDMQALYLAGYIELYQVDSAEYLQIVKWWEYQQMQWAKASDHPAPPGWMDKYRYHGKGRQILTSNWDKDGGFIDNNCKPLSIKDKDKDDDDDNPRRLPNPVPSRVGSALASDRYSAVFNHYLHATTYFPNQLLSEQISDLIDELETARKELTPGAPGSDIDGAGWVMAAIDEAVASANGTIGFKYILAITDRWRKQGFKASRPSKNAERETQLPQRIFR